MVLRSRSNHGYIQEPSLNQSKTDLDIQQVSSTLASVANNSDDVSVLIIGAGRGGLAMLNVLA